MRALAQIDPNQTRSASAAYQLSVKIKRHPIVQNVLEQARIRAEEAVRDAINRYGITADRIADEMARLAFTQVRQVVDIVTEVDPATKVKRQVVKVRDFADVDTDAHRAIVGVETKTDGSIVVKLGDKRQALMDLARLKGMIADKPAESTQLVMLKIER